MENPEYNGLDIHFTDISRTIEQMMNYLLFFPFIIIVDCIINFFNKKLAEIFLKKILMK